MVADDPDFPPPRPRRSPVRIVEATGPLRIHKLTAEQSARFEEIVRDRDHSMVVLEPVHDVRREVVRPPLLPAMLWIIIATVIGIMIGVAASVAVIRPAAAAASCQSSLPPKAARAGYWRYRVVGGRRCWFGRWAKGHAPRVVAAKPKPEAPLPPQDEMPDVWPPRESFEPKGSFVNRWMGDDITNSHSEFDARFGSW